MKPAGDMFKELFERFGRELAFGGMSLGIVDAEIITQPLYDSAPCRESGGDYYFFARPVGTEDADGTPKSFEQTNMFLSSQLPYGQAFIISGVELRLSQRVYDVDDEAEFYNSGVVTLDIGCKVYLWDAPAGEFRNEKSPAVRINFDLKGDAVDATASSGKDYEPLTLTPNDLLIVASQNFRLSLAGSPPLRRWKTSRIFARLHGQMIRSLA